MSVLSKLSLVCINEAQAATDGLIRRLEGSKTRKSLAAAAHCVVDECVSKTQIPSDFRQK